MQRVFGLLLDESFNSDFLVQSHSVLLQAPFVHAEKLSDDGRASCRFSTDAAKILLVDPTPSYLPYTERSLMLLLQMRNEGRQAR